MPSIAVHICQVKADIAACFVCIYHRQGSSKSNRSNRSDRGPSGPASPKLDRHPSLRFSVKKQSSPCAVATSGGSRNEDVQGGADPYTILATLQRQALSSSFKTSPAEFSGPRDVLATVGLSPRGSRDDLAKVLLGAAGWRCTFLTTLQANCTRKVQNLRLCDLDQ